LIEITISSELKLLFKEWWRPVMKLDTLNPFFGSPHLAWFVLLAGFFSCLPNDASAAQGESNLQPIPVKLVKQDDGWRMLRGGQPYYIKGAGGMGDLAALKKFGANSTRIWGIEETTLQRLDEAHRQDLTVAVGIWLEHERHGFAYSDEDAVQKQFDKVIEAVEKFKNHPAVLLWGIGNEMEGAGNNPKIWKHIEKLCAEIKKIDANHPTMTVIAEMGDNKIAAIHHHCPSLDVIGINSYGGATSVPARYREHGGIKPYLVTEFGPLGAWEVGKNSIGAVVEETSTAKTRFYLEAYDAITADKEFCLGSYAFLYGHKQEATATWFGLFLADGNRTAALDALAERWSGKPVENQCPRIEELKLIGELEVKPSTIVELQLKARDPENDPLNVDWVLMEEADSYSTGGDFQETPKSFDENILAGDGSKAAIKLPAADGLYRIYVYLNDGKGGGASANQSIRVRGSKPQPGAKVDLPLVVYDELDSPPTYASSGWMGNSEQVKLNPEHAIDPKRGKHCLECKYMSTEGWAGVVWQHPANDWGEVHGGFDLNGAKALTFWAKGEQGGEEIKFGYGLLGPEKKFGDTSSHETVIRLTSQWQQYSIDLASKDLTRIKTGFYWTVAGQPNPLTFYLDAIEFK
jgi:hypothetical protein